MNFYKHHIGDYQKKTAALSLTEHGAYLLMLQHYYATEKPLPSGRDLYRLLRATTKPDRDAINRVAQQFWEKTDAGLVNGRAVTEIKKADHQRIINREVGKLGGRPKTERVSENKPRTSEKPKTESVSENKPNRNPIQTPLVKNSEPSGSAPDGAVSDADLIFGLGLPLLEAAGVKEKNARSMLGLMRKQHGEKAVVNAVQRCAEVQAIEPVAWLQAALKSKSGTPTAASIAAEAMRLHEAREAVHEA